MSISFQGENGHPYLSNEDNEDEDKANPGSADAKGGMERDLVESAAVELPGRSEADVGQADGAPGEESGKTGKSEEPVEDDNTAGAVRHVGEAAESNDDDGREQGATGAINVGEDLRSVTLLSESGESAGTTVDTAVTDGNDGDDDDDVDEVVEANQASILGGDDERRSSGVDDGVGAKESLVVVTDKEANEEEGENVEEGDTPENLLDGTRELLGGVRALGGRETDELRTGESKGGGDEHGADALEAVGEGARVVPEPGAPVRTVLAVVRATAQDADETDHDEDDDGDELEERRPELFLSEAEDAEDVDQDDGDQEDGYPDSDADVHLPVVDGDTGDDEFERKNDGPLEDVVPTHGKSPRRIDEAGGIGVETTRDRVHDGEFTKSVDDVEDHNTDDTKVEQERGRALDNS